MAINTFVLKTADQIRDSILQDYANALIRRGISNPNVSFGSEIFCRAQAVATQLAVAMSNTQLASDAQMPDSAQGTDLARIAAQYGLSLRPAGGSVGSLTLSATVTTPILIPTGSQLVDPAGLKYQVSTGGTYSNGQQIPIAAVDTGAATNLAANTVLKWTAPPPFVNQTALVFTGGLTGGADQETYEGLRTRLISYIQNPPASGNWSQINAAAEASTVSVQKAFTYAAANGPGTVHVAVVTAPTTTNKNRDLNSTVLSTVVTPAISAILPEFVELVPTTVQNQVADVSIALSIPTSTSASPPGPGGGWLDGTPFPVYATNGYANVTSVTSSTQFAVNSDVAPTANVSHVCWLSPVDWILYTGTVIAVSGTGPYTITVDKPFTNIATGHFISPQAANSQTYFNALLSAFAGLGPGQKTNATGVLPRAYRKPLVAQSWPSDLTAAVLKVVINSGAEVLDDSYLYRSITTPPLPSLITQGPFVLVPRNTAFYPSV